MVRSKKDTHGRVFHKGEIQRFSDGRYLYTYTDPLGKHRYICASDLLSLREKEEKLIKDQSDGLDRYAVRRTSANDVFDRYTSIRYNLWDNTRSGYIYMYNRFVREDFGRHELIDIKYSNVLQYHFCLLNGRNLVSTTPDSIHCIFYPTFQFVVRDDIIRRNPANGVVAEVKKKTGMHRNIRYALAVEWQRTFMDYMANHPVYVHRWPILTILLGAECRIEEAPEFRWQDLGFEKGITTIGHALVYYGPQGLGDYRLRVSKSKTKVGIRTIPVLDVMREVFQVLQDEEIGNEPNL